MYIKKKFNFLNKVESMKKTTKPIKSDNPTKFLDCPTIDPRRTALQKIAKYSIYCAPILLATISSKASAGPVSG
jgi:hypothetical protein